MQTLDTKKLELIAGINELAKTMTLPDYLTHMAYQAPSLVMGNGCTIFLVCEDALVLGASTKTSLFDKIGQEVYTINRDLYYTLEGIEAGDANYRQQLQKTGLTGWIAAFNMYLLLDNIKDYSLRKIFTDLANNNRETLRKNSYMTDDIQRLPVPNWSNSLLGSQSIKDDSKPLLAVPIRYNNQVIGVIRIETKTSGKKTFSETDAAILQCYADSIGTELQKKGYQGNEEKIKYLLRMRSVDDIIDLTKLNANIVNHLWGQKTSDVVCTIILTTEQEYFSTKDPKEWIYRVVASEGEFSSAKDRDNHNKFKEAIPSIQPYKYGEGMTGLALKYKTPIHIQLTHHPESITILYPDDIPELHNIELQYITTDNITSDNKPAYETMNPDFENLLLLPILDPDNQENSLGVIRIISHGKDRGITEQDIFLLASYAHIFANRILEKWKYSEIKFIDQQYYDITQYNDFKDFILRTAYFFSHLVDADAVSFFIKDNASSTNFQLRHTHYRSPYRHKDYASKFRELQRQGLSYQKDESKTGAALSMGIILAIKNCENRQEWTDILDKFQSRWPKIQVDWEKIREASLHDKTHELGEHTGPMLYVPLMDHNKNVWGLLRAVRLRESAVFSKDEIQLANLFRSGLTSVKDGLLSSLQQRSIDDSLNEIYRFMYQSNSIDEILYLMLIGLTHKKAIGIDRCILFNCIRINNYHRLEAMLAIGEEEKTSSSFFSSPQQENRDITEFLTCITKYHADPQCIYFEPLLKKLQHEKIFISSDFITKTIPEPQLVLNELVSRDQLPTELCYLLKKIDADNLLLFLLVFEPGKYILGVCDNIYEENEITPLQITLCNVLIGRTIEALNHLEHENQKRTNELKALQSISAMAAHRLRNIIPNARKWIDDLIEKLDKNDTENRQRAFKAKGQLIRALDVVTDLTRLSKDPDYDLPGINCHDLYNIIKDHLHEKLEHIIFTCDDAITRYTANCNCDIFVEIFDSFLIDSFKYNDDQSKIEVTISFAIIDNTNLPENYFSREQHYLFLSYKDNGPGIEKSKKEKIFDPFFSESGGMGFGLPIAKKHIEYHNGIIQETGMYGRGVEFEIYIPVKESDQ